MTDKDMHSIGVVAVLLTVWLVTAALCGERPSDKDQALISAAVGGRVDEVKCLLDQSANINAKDKEGTTALVRASQLGHIEVVTLLLARGADVEAADKRGWTALVWAIQFGHSELVRLFLAEGANVNTKDERGWTPLTIASQESNLRMRLAERVLTPVHRFIAIHGLARPRKHLTGTSGGVLANKQGMA